jgi:hypothetical protein
MGSNKAHKKQAARRSQENITATTYIAPTSFISKEAVKSTSLFNTS